MAGQRDRAAHAEGTEDEDGGGEVSGVHVVVKTIARRLLKGRGA